MRHGWLRWLLSLLGFLAIGIGVFGCGEEVATPGASIAAPPDVEFTYTNWPGSIEVTAAPLEFQVFVDENAIDEPLDEPRPMPGATVRYYGGGQVLDQVVALTDREGNVLNPEDPLFFETQTDSRGLSPTDIYVAFSVPQCQADPTDPTAAGPDINVTGTVLATIGVDSATWTVNITVKGGTVANGCS